MPFYLGESDATPMSVVPGMGACPCISPALLMLNNHFRMLWEQHSEWTGLAVTALVRDLPGTDEILQRLLRNPQDFREALLPLYGAGDAFKFAELLTEHLNLAAEMLQALKAGNDKEAGKIEKKWYANADEIAQFLGSINPYWSFKQWQQMFYIHLGLIQELARELFCNNYAKAIVIYDRLEQEALMMADMMIWGIIRQFFCPQVNKEC